MTTATLVVQQLVKRYGNLTAVAGVNLEVHPGELVGLIGPDGAGKSSLMKSIAGVMSYDQGSIHIRGHSVGSEREAEVVKPMVGFMPQGLGQNLYPDLSIDENIDFVAHLRLVPEEAMAQRKERLLRMTRLDAFANRPMKNLSGGMKQKLGLICTLLHEPALIILDEPTTGVDPVSRRDFWTILSELLVQHGISALVSSAYLDEASRFDRVALMHQGIILAQGKPQELLQLVPATVVNIRLDDQMTALARLRPHFPQALGLGEWIRTMVPTADHRQASEQVRQILGDLPCQELLCEPPELEDVVVERLRADQDEQATTIPKAPPRHHAAPAPLAPGALAIEAQALCKVFGAFQAVDHVSFRIPQGEIFGLLGANGAGKTTVIKMLTGILKPSSGDGQVAGVDMSHSGPMIRQRIGYMSQSFSLYFDLTVEENLKLYAAIYGVSRREQRARLPWILAVTELTARRGDLAAALPMGLRQRLALGCALIHAPPILFLDEPTSGVDPLGRRRFWDILFQLARQEGVAMLITTHYMTEAEYCDHLALMHAGAVIADDSPKGMKQALVKRLGHVFEVETQDPYRAQQLLQQGDFPHAHLHGRRVRLFSQHETAVVEQRITARLESQGLGEFGVSRSIPSMEDVFIENVLEMERRSRMAAAAT